MKVLIVDDELISRTKLDKLVKSLGYETLVASDGKEGLALWLQYRPRMVITDWVMPEMSGYELVKEIKRLQGNQFSYTIMITSQNDTEHLVSGIEAGADDFLSKPFIKEVLSVRIKAAQRILSFESRDLVIFAMARLAEERDTDTGFHLERIRHYSKILAKQIERDNKDEGLTPFFIDNIFMTSPLHDIGKIGIPDFVLLKPGRLDEKEFSIMKQHTTIGYTALKAACDKYPKADYLKMSSEIALYHHEKFDGSGYPSGISNKDIPVSARIVALADVYDALVSKRVYKSAMPHDMAKSIIISEKGKHFDPVVVEAFLKREQQFIDVLDKYKNN
ncbi:MAG TPA: HD domain-containing phosphohydrolase [Chitinispirillaceae bacterium]|jgi:putative two-component system response regulator|nr:HD domain-containing phosphohydrolase [Chitinispirillaceae bacterium]